MKVQMKKVSTDVTFSIIVDSLLVRQLSSKNGRWAFNSHLFICTKPMFLAAISPSRIQGIYG